MKNLVLLLSFLILVTTNYSCKDTEEDCVCIEIYQPVCGNDGNEYANSCKAECAGVTYSDGFCEVETDAKVVDFGSLAIDGCGWLLEFEVDGETKNFHPNNLTSAFEQDQLEVKITYKPTLLDYTCGLVPNVYPEIELVSIENL